MTFSRRQLFAGAATGAAALVLDDITFGGLNANALAYKLDLDHDTFGLLDSTVLGGTRPHPTTFQAQDWTDGTVMWNGGYSDMPYMVATPDGTLVAVITVNTGDEGTSNQHVVVTRSIDGGQTWSPAVDLEPAAGPEASWGMPWHDPTTGRLYVVYVYNIDNVRNIPNNDGTGAGASRVDSVGVIAYRSSTDGGVTWTERSTLEVPRTAIDSRNPFNGSKVMFWMSGHPQQRNGAVCIGLSKMGRVVGGGQFIDTEAFTAQLWETTPGVLAVALSAPIRAPGAISEEPSPIVFGDGTLNVAFRTATGQLGEAWSTDDGVSWMVDWSRDINDGIIPQPRANGSQFALPDGRILLWGHNNNSVPENTFTGPRNPVFCRIGETVGPRIVWGPPRLLLWDRDPATRISYPSLIVTDTHLLVAATDKATARLFEYPLVGL